MRLTKQQFKLLVENYLFEQEDNNSSDNPDAEDISKNADEETKEKQIPDEIKFKVDTKNGFVDITLKKTENESDHIVYVDGDKASNIDGNMDIQIIAAHGYKHQETSDEVRSMLVKILNRDSDFKGKNQSGVLAIIDDKMSSRLGAQSLGVDSLEKVLDKG